MILARTIIATVLLVFAGCIVLMNWGCVIVNLRNQKKGIDKYYSMFFVFQTILVLIAFLLYPHTPKWWIWIFALLDLSNWSFLSVPFCLIAERMKK